MASVPGSGVADPACVAIDALRASEINADCVAVASRCNAATSLNGNECEYGFVGRRESVRIKRTAGVIPQAYKTRARTLTTYIK